jgi:hypothetical protein
MTSRERFLACVERKKADRLPFVIQWGPWGDAHSQWKEEGMKNDGDWYALFGFDPYQVGIPVNTGIYPSYKEEVLADEGDKIVFRDAHGVVKRDRKGSTTMPQFLEYPVKDWKTWEEHKWRFDPDSPERFPSNWDETAKALKDSDALVTTGIYPYGFMGGPRTMMGAEAYLVACALEPELIDDICATLCNLWYKLWSRVLDETRVDHIAMWEDMSGKQGSLISPRMFRRFMTPYYQKLTDLARKHVVKMISVDSDGYMHELTELFLEAGVNVIMPYEVQADNDIPYLLKKHPELIAFGGMDKRAMTRDKSTFDIDAEIERVKAITTLGHYVPFPDHLIPADVSWENYQYFVWRWKEMVGKKD